jgi:DNA replication and repair protein RecF
MFLNNIEIRDFRNHSAEKLSFSLGINCFIGENATGKTNILEAIYFSSTLASFRPAKDEDLIRWGKEAFSIITNIKTKDNTHLLQMGISQKKKAFAVDGIKKDKSSEFVGILKTVFFSPEDLNLIKGGPQYRRRFLDHFLVQLFPAYHHYLNTYRRVMKEKNTLLRQLKSKKTTDETLLDVYDEQIAQIAAWITLKRLNILKKILPLAKKYHAKINPKEDLHLQYHSSVPIESDELTYEKLSKVYLAALGKVRKEEILRCLSLTGPQRDEIIITVNKKSLKEYGSQGQQRTAAIALKLTQADIFKSEEGDTPIILLDDIFSELDEIRRNNIIEIIKKEMQVFITATETELIPKEYRKEAKIFMVSREGIKE